jgi:hypothetical protein
MRIPGLEDGGGKLVHIKNVDYIGTIVNNPKNREYFD